MTILTETPPPAPVDDAPTCPSWCNQHEASDPALGLPREHTHHGVHRTLVDGHATVVELIQVSFAADAAGVVAPVDDAPYVSVTVRGADRTDFQGELPTLLAACSALTAAVAGTVAP